MCTAIAGPQTDYLIGLSYPGATLWVSTADEPNACTPTFNGEFTSQTYLGGKSPRPSPPVPG
jgi:hypothetical protein